MWLWASVTGAAGQEITMLWQHIAQSEGRSRGKNSRAPLNPIQDGISHGSFGKFVLLILILAV
jgi:hypothetical protein